jgi:hypothetical protein
MAMMADAATEDLKLKGIPILSLNDAAWCRLGTVKQQKEETCNNIVPIIEWSDHIPIGVTASDPLARRNKISCVVTQQDHGQGTTTKTRKRLSHAVQ